MATKQGHIKIYRSIEDWRWFNTPHMLEFWLRLLLKANWKDEEKDGELFNRGEIVTSIPDLAKETGLTVKQVRVFLGRLVETGEITMGRARSRALSRTRCGTSCRTRITICNYETYQSLGREVGQKVRHEVGTEVGNPPSSPSSSSPTPSSSTPPISPSFSEAKEEKKEGDTVVSPKKERVDFQFVQKLWNETMARTRKIPKVAALSQARKDKISLRIGEMGGWENAKETLATCFRKINESEFCNGENENVWVATFDWFFSNEKNWMKVIEGNYDNRQRKSQLEIFAENVAKANAYYEQRYHGYGGASPYGDQARGREDGPDEQ